MSRHPHRLNMALQVRADCKRGPAFLQELPEDLQDRYRLWTNTWVVPYLDTLIPELRKLDEKKVDAP